MYHYIIRHQVFIFVEEIEDFWIQKGDMFGLVRDFAVKDANGKYLGTLKTTKNVKPIRDVQGENDTKL